MSVGNDYIYVGTVLGLRNCRNRWNELFPEDAQMSLTPRRSNRLSRFFRRDGGTNGEGALVADSLRKIFFT